MYEVQMKYSRNLFFETWLRVTFAKKFMKAYYFNSNLIKEFQMLKKTHPFIWNDSEKNQFLSTHFYGKTWHQSIWHAYD